MKTDKKAIAEISFLGIQASTNEQLSIDYLEGHKGVLINQGIDPILIMRSDWISNPNVYLILVINLADEKILGGARVQINDGLHQLPIYPNILPFDENIEQKLNTELGDRYFEICGLWNSYRTAGLGIGSVYLVRACLALAGQLKLERCLALCSPYTNRIVNDMGFRPYQNFGDSGSIPYPTEKFISTLQVNSDVSGLSLATEAERNYVLEVRKTPQTHRVETMLNGSRISLHYDFKIDSALPKI